MGGACSTHGRDEKFMQILFEKPEGKSPLGRLCVDGRIMDLREIGYKVVGWIHVDQDRNQLRDLVNTVTNPRFS